MQKNLFITQKIVFVIYSVVMLLLFVYALSFMTDFKELFGQSNRAIAEFHDVTLQGFNRLVFTVGIISVLSFVALVILEIKNKIADYFALAFVGASAVFNTVMGIILIPQLMELKDVYLQLDFDSLLLSVGQVYTVTTRTFDMGVTLYLVSIVVSLVLIVVTSVNTNIYLRKNRGDLDE